MGGGVTISSSLNERTENPIENFKEQISFNNDPMASSTLGSRVIKEVANAH